LGSSGSRDSGPAPTSRPRRRPGFGPRRSRRSCCRCSPGPASPPAAPPPGDCRSGPARRCSSPRCGSRPRSRRRGAQVLHLVGLAVTVVVQVVADLDVVSRCRFADQALAVLGASPTGRLDRSRIRPVARTPAVGPQFVGQPVAVVVQVVADLDGLSLVGVAEPTARPCSSAAPGRRPPCRRWIPRARRRSGRCSRHRRRCRSRLPGPARCRPRRHRRPPGGSIPGPPCRSRSRSPGSRGREPRPPGGRGSPRRRRRSPETPPLQQQIQACVAPGHFRCHAGGHAEPPLGSVGQAAGHLPLPTAQSESFEHGRHREVRGGTQA
jgi:hypothetical protein